MTDTTPHRATHELPPPEPTVWSAINALADRLAAAEQRISELQTSATCPHIVSSDEGTSYCRLAEQATAATPPEPAPVGSLVERVAIACAKPCNETWDDQARAAIRAVAEWMRENEISFHAAYCLNREVN